MVSVQFRLLLISVQYVCFIVQKCFDFDVLKATKP